MKEKCIVPGCQTTTKASLTKGKSRKSFIKFPLKNEKLLKQWISQIPGNHAKINSSSRICEDHFEGKFKIKNKSSVEVAPEACPTIFKEKAKEFQNQKRELRQKKPENNSEVCRFCSGKLGKDNLEITDQLRENFECFTGIDLKLSDNYSNHICLPCNRKFDSSLKFRKKLIEQQLKLYEDLEVLEEVKTEKEEVITQETPVEAENVFDFDKFMEKELGSQIQDHNLEELSTKTKKTKAPKKKETPEISLCTECGLSFTKRALNRHIARRHTLYKGDFCCDLCDYQTHEKTTLRLHIGRHIKSQNYSCPEPNCDKKFSIPQKLNIHIKSVHYKKEEQHLCNSCGKVFRTIHGLSDHVRSMHMLEPTFTCQIDNCGKQFKHRSLYQIHKQKHKNIKYQCQDCPKFYYSSIEFTRHKRTHDRKHKCLICNKGFLAPSLLLNHQKVFHEGSQEHSCNFCEKIYSTRKYLTRHIIEFHMNIKIQCEVENCTSQFARKETYRNHVLSHHSDLGDEMVQEMLLRIRELKIQLNESAIVR